MSWPGSGVVSIGIPSVPGLSERGSAAPHRAVDQSWLSRMDSNDPFGPASESDPERLGLEHFDLIAETE